MEVNTHNVYVYNTVPADIPKIFWNVLVGHVILFQSSGQFSATSPKK